MTIEFANELETVTSLSDRRGDRRILAVDVVVAEAVDLIVERVPVEDFGVPRVWILRV
jgi:hypothetical protein